MNTTKYSVLLNQSLAISYDDIVSNFSVVAELVEDVLKKRCAPYYVPTIGLGGRCIPSIVPGQNIV